MKVSLIFTGIKGDSIETDTQTKEQLEEKLGTNYTERSQSDKAHKLLLKCLLKRKNKK